jgi:hypothetical protein
MMGMLLLTLCTPRQGGNVNAKEAIRDAEARRIRALLESDRKALDEVLDDDLAYTHTNGAVDRKIDLVEKVASGIYMYRGFDVRDLQIRTLGDRAGVAMGEALMTIQVGQDHVDVLLRFLSVYAKRSETWRLVAYQSTRLAG